MRLARQYQNTPIQVQGRILGTGSIPLSNIPVRLGETETVTNILGEYFFPSVPRQNKLLEIDTPDYYQEIIPLVLSLPLTISQIEVPDTSTYPFGKTDRLKNLISIWRRCSNG